MSDLSKTFADNIEQTDYYQHERMFCPPDELIELAAELSEEDARRCIEAAREIAYFRKLLGAD